MGADLPDIRVVMLIFQCCCHRYRTFFSHCTELRSTSSQRPPALFCQRKTRGGYKILRCLSPLCFRQKKKNTVPTMESSVLWSFLWLPVRYVLSTLNIHDKTFITLLKAWLAATLVFLFPQSKHLARLHSYPAQRLPYLSANYTHNQTFVYSWKQLEKWHTINRAWLNFNEIGTFTDGLSRVYCFGLLVNFKLSVIWLMRCI